MVEKDNPSLSISRASFYYQLKGETAMNLMLIRQIDEQFLETPFFCCSADDACIAEGDFRQMTWHLRNDEHLVNEKRIRRLMRLMGLIPIYQKPAPGSPSGSSSTITNTLTASMAADRPFWFTGQR